MMYQFSEYSKESVLDAVARMWDLNHKVPFPKFDLQCPVCSDEIWIMVWCYFVRKNPYSKNPYRCDVYIKCTGCCKFWQHGIVIPEEQHPEHRKVIPCKEIMATGNYPFPKVTKESEQTAVSRMWDLSGSVPLPEFEITCPACSHDEILPKHFVFSIKNNSYPHNPHRCNVFMKCTRCSMVWEHRLVVPESMHPGRRKVILWREVKKELEGKE